MTNKYIFVQSLFNPYEILVWKVIEMNSLLYKVECIGVSSILFTSLRVRHIDIRRVAPTKYPILTAEEYFEQETVPY